MIALVIAAIFALPQDVPAADFSYVDDAGWENYGANNEGTLVLLQPGRERGFVWVRFEYLSTTKSGLRSMRALIELDCARWRTRATQIEGFAAPNLMDGDGAVATNADWTYAAPSTINEMFLDYGCGD